MSASILNLSGYRFVTLDGLPSLREHVFEHAHALGMRGTVLLAEEGINLLIAGERTAAREWLARLRADERLAALDVKESVSDAMPFRHLRVKIKREIIRMNQPQVRPEAGRASAIEGPTLARWLDAGHDDAGREVVVLDTRNGFEVDAGSFEHALDWRLRKFSDFPAAIEAQRGALAGRTVVTCCTGGIRCEKAALALRAAGIEHVHQLDGGILRYFEQVSGARHWRGRCFVFDARGSLGTDLAPAS